MGEALARHPVLAITTTLVVSVVSALALFRVFPPTYASSCTVRVDPLMPRVLYESDEWRTLGANYYQFFVRTIAERALEHGVLEAADRLLLQDGVDWTDEPDAQRRIAALRAMVRSERERDTYFVRVSAEGTHPQFLAAIANAVGASLIEVIAAERAEGEAAVEGPLVQDESRLIAALSAVREELDTRRNTSPTDAGTSGGLAMSRVQDLVKRHGECAAEVAAAEAATLAARVRASAHDDPPPSAVLAATDEDPVLRSCIEETAVETRRLTDLISGLAPQHPLRRDAEARVAARASDLEQKREAVRVRVTERLRTESEAEARLTLTQAEERLSAAVHRCKALSVALQDAQATVDAAARHQIEVDRLREAEARCVGDLARVQQRLEQIRTEAQAPPRVAIQSPGIRPITPVRNLSLPVAGLALVLGVTGGLGVAMSRVHHGGRLLRVIDLKRRNARVLGEGEQSAIPERSMEWLLAFGTPTDQDTIDLIVTAAPDTESQEMALRVSQALYGAAAERSNVVLVEPHSSVGSGDSWGEVLRERSNVGVATRWLVPSDGRRLSRLMNERRFLDSWDALETGQSYRIAATPPPTLSTAALTLVHRGVPVLLVVARGVTSSQELEETLTVLSSWGGHDVRVLLLDGAR